MTRYQLLTSYVWSIPLFVKLFVTEVILRLESVFRFLPHKLEFPLAKPRSLATFGASSLRLLNMRTLLLES